jgi:hypothetical protein
LARDLSGGARDGEQAGAFFIGHAAFYFTITPGPSGHVLFYHERPLFFLNGGLCYSYKIKNIKTPSIQSTLCLYHPLRLLGPGELQVVLCVKLAHPGSGRSVAGAATERAIEPPC